MAKAWQVPLRSIHYRHDGYDSAMSGSSDGKSAVARFGQRHAEGIRIIVGFVLCTYGTVATYKAFHGMPKQRGRFLLFIILTMALLILFVLLYRLLRTKVPAKRAWLAALLLSCWPLIIAWGIPSRYGGPPIMIPTGVMAHRVPGYVLTILWGLVLAWNPLSSISRHPEKS